MIMPIRGLVRFCMREKFVLMKAMNQDVFRIYKELWYTLAMYEW